MFANHCARCEKEFTTSKANQGFCSRVCRNRARDSYGWKQAKKAAKKRDGRCQGCGTEESLEVHHRHEMSKGIDNDLDNLITLCTVCHKAEHDRMKMEVAA